MATDFDRKTVAFSTATAVGFWSFGPVSAFVAAGGALFYRCRALSLSTPYNQRLEEELRLKDNDGVAITEMCRFVEDLDLVQLTSLQSTSTNSSRALQLPMTQLNPTLKFLEPLAAEHGMIFTLQKGLDDEKVQEFLRIQFSKDGLTYQFSDTLRVGAKYEWAALRKVCPFDLATCLFKMKNKTYNAVTWNSHSVTDRLWTQMCDRSNDNISRGHGTLQT